VILSPDCTGTNCSTSTKITLFLGGDDGFLYKVVYDSSVGIPVVTSVNLTRPGCVGDKIKATPSVQLYRFSDTAFRGSIDASPGHTGNDLVIVGTFYPDQGGLCPGAQNRVYGLFASDLSIKWIFNQTGAMALDPVTEACPLEYYSGAPPAGTPNNTAICGFNKSGVNNGLIAFNTATNLAAGTPRWAVDTVGGVVNRPVIATLNGRRAVYVGCNDGTLRAYSPTSGMFLWTGGAPSVGNMISQNIWAEFRSGPLQNRIFVLDPNGALHMFVDNGASGTEMGTPVMATPPAKFVSMPVLAPGLGTLYLGRNDGTVQQVSSSMMAQETQVVGASTANVFDPSLDIAPDGTVTNLVVTAGSSGMTPGKIARFLIPFCPMPPPG
jgi:hypothetical protein